MRQKRTSATQIRTCTLPASHPRGLQFCCRAVAHPSTPADCSWPAGFSSICGLPHEVGLGTACENACRRPPKLPAVKAVKVLQARNWHPVVQPRSWKLRPTPAVRQLRVQREAARPLVCPSSFSLDSLRTMFPNSQRGPQQQRRRRQRSTIPLHLRQSVSRTAVWCRGICSLVALCQCNCHCAFRLRCRHRLVFLCIRLRCRLHRFKLGAALQIHFCQLTTLRQDGYGNQYKLQTQS